MRDAVKRFEQHRRERVEKVCARKKHHPSKVKARQAAANRRKKWGHAVFFYDCPCGDGWLLTSQPQKQSDITRAQRGQRLALKQPPTNTEGDGPSDATTNTGAG